MKSESAEKTRLLYYNDRDTSSSGEPQKVSKCRSQCNSTFKTQIKTTLTGCFIFMCFLIIYAQTKRIYNSCLIFPKNAIHPQTNGEAFSKEELYLRYLKAMETNLCSNWSKVYSETQQLAGTNLKMVEWAKAQYESFGFENVEIDQYDVYMSYPISSNLELLDKDGDLVYKPTLREDVLEEDPNSSYYVPAFLGYAESGDVTAEYIYCNFGTKEDFELLAKSGVDLKGKIAVIRYGKIFRGLKVLFAQQHQMAAVLLYSDPFEDGEVIVQNGYKPYPHGLARQPSSIQRGSVQFLSYGPGDPTTPGYAIKPGEVKSRSDPYYTTPRIPALPISYREVTPILQNLNGHGLSIDGWSNKTGLIENFDYSTGPNPDYKLNLMNDQEFNISTMNNIMMKIEGSTNPNDIIIIGNHHDSWIPSAGDPHSGSVVLMELGRGLMELVKQGWKPNRSIWLASWDGEEPGLIGSTEFAEYYSAKLQKNVVAYLNLDVAAIGDTLAMGASPILYDFLKSTAKLVDYPGDKHNLTLFGHFAKHNNASIGNLGSGSDYTVFLDHLGIPSVDLGFKNKLTNSAVYHYHSIYDSYTWMSKYGDPDFKSHNLMSKYLGLLVINLSQSEVIPFKINSYAEKLIELFELIKVPEKWLLNEVSSDESGVTVNYELKDITNGAYADLPPFSKRRPCHNDTVNNLNDLMEEVKNNLNLLLSRCQTLDDASDKLAEDWNNFEELNFWGKLKLKFSTHRMNSKLKYFERNFLNPNGLSKGRSWFKHIVFSSGRYTGYAGQTLPGLAETIEDDDYVGFLENLKYFNKVVKRLGY